MTSLLNGCHDSQSGNRKVQQVFTDVWLQLNVSVISHKNADEALSFMSLGSGFVVLKLCGINHEWTSKEYFQWCLTFFFLECFSRLRRDELFYASLCC